MKLLLFGAEGRLGWELQRSLAPLGAVVAVGRGEADLREPQALSRRIAAEAPQVVVNAAGFTRVDDAEARPEEAMQVNGLAPGAMARAARDAGAWMLHYSTDYVFPGHGRHPLDEDAPTGPLNVYGRSKLAGERAVRDSGVRHLILRTSWLHGTRGDCFPAAIVRLAMERDRLEVVDDQVGAPTGTDLVADVSAHALRAALADASLAGTYHVAAAGETSWHGCAHHALQWAARHGLPLRTSADDLVPVPGSALPRPAARPSNCRLDTRRLCTAFGLAMPDWRQGVDRTLQARFGRN